MTFFRVAAAAVALALTAHCSSESIGVATASAVDNACAAGSEEGSCVAPLEEESTQEASKGLLGGISLGQASSLFFRKCA